MIPFSFIWANIFKYKFSLNTFYLNYLIVYKNHCILSLNTCQNKKRKHETKVKLLWRQGKYLSLKIELCEQQRLAGSEDHQIKWGPGRQVSGIELPVGCRTFWDGKARILCQKQPMFDVRTSVVFSVVPLRVPYQEVILNESWPSRTCDNNEERNHSPSIYRDVLQGFSVGAERILLSMALHHSFFQWLLLNQIMLFKFRTLRCKESCKPNRKVLEKNKRSIKWNIDIKILLISTLLPWIWINKSHRRATIPLDSNGETRWHKIWAYRMSCFLKGKTITKDIRTVFICPYEKPKLRRLMSANVKVFTENARYRFYRKRKICKRWKRYHMWITS